MMANSKDAAQSSCFVMKVSGGMVSLLLLMVPLIGPGFARETRYLYHIPWACSLKYKYSDLIGAGALINMDKVLVSVDNFNETVRGSNPPKRYFEVLHDVVVFAGSNFAFPYMVKKTPSGSAYLPYTHYAQRRNVEKFYVAFKSPSAIGWLPEGSWDIKINPDDISKSAGADFDVYGLGFNVGILLLYEPFYRNSYLLPMLIKGPDLPDRTREFKDKLEKSPGTHVCLTYSWNDRRNRIRYHEVTYLPESNCQEVFCYWNIRYCKEFPNKDYLLCFKSVKYADVCPIARGAALYCPGFESSVVAILTTAPSCGQRNMPGVYTTISWVVDFYEKALKEDFDLGKRTSYDLFALPQINSDYEGVL